MKAILMTMAWCGLIAPLAAQDAASAHPLQQLMEQISAEEISRTPEQRAEVFAALSILPADTDSFLAVGRLPEIIGAVAGNGVLFPGLEKLESVAVGLSERALKDLQRMTPLFQILSETGADATDEWMTRAEPEAARAIVAQRRAALHALGEQLVASTRELHMGPVYVVLSCQPGGEALLQQLSVLPLMIPLEADGPLELVVRGTSRGFCVRGDKLDLSVVGLEPQHEEQIRTQLRELRLYVMTQVAGNHLVLSICSNPDEVKLPTQLADSLLATDKMAAFDACLHGEACAVGLSSAAAVQLREEGKLSSYTGMARFMGKVFARLAPGNTAAAEASVAMERLLHQLTSGRPACTGGERFMVWRRQNDYYLHFSCDAGGLQFEPGTWSQLSCASAPNTVFWAESTHMRGIPALDVPAVVADLEVCQKGYLSTLRPECRKLCTAQLEQLRQARPALAQLAEGVQKLDHALGGNLAILLQEPASAGQVPAFSLRADVADESALKEAGQLLQAGVASLTQEPGEAAPESGVRREMGQGALLVHNGLGGMSLAPAAAPQSVQGGAVFALNFASLARTLASLAQRAQSEDLSRSAAHAAAVAEQVERLDGIVTTRNNRFRLLLRVRVRERK